jgi:hypothetical protein
MHQLQVGCAHKTLSARISTSILYTNYQSYQVEWVEVHVPCHVSVLQTRDAQLTTYTPYTRRENGHRLRQTKPFLARACVSVGWCPRSLCS